MSQAPAPVPAEPAPARVVVPTATGAHLLERSQRVPGTLEEVFAFFGQPANLERLTPGDMRFRVHAMDTPELGDGTLIDYRLSVKGLPLRWRSRIVSWEPPHRFVDVQVKGPYRTWHHLHAFEQHRNPITGALEVEVTDRVHYTVLSDAPLLRPLEDLLDRLFVRRDVARVFEFRRAKMAELFPARPEPMTL